MFSDILVLPRITDKSDMFLMFRIEFPCVGEFLSESSVHLVSAVGTVILHSITLSKKYLINNLYH